MMRKDHFNQKLLLWPQAPFKESIETILDFSSKGLKVIWFLNNYNTCKMEYQKIPSLLNKKSDLLSEFMTRNWVEINDQCNSIYTNLKRIEFPTGISKSNICDIVLQVTVIGTENNAITFKNCALTASC